jgi:hypothetical protein
MLCGIRQVCLVSLRRKCWDLHHTLPFCKVLNRRSLTLKGILNNREEEPQLDSTKNIKGSYMNLVRWNCIHRGKTEGGKFQKICEAN